MERRRGETGPLRGAQGADPEPAKALPSARAPHPIAAAWTRSNSITSAVGWNGSAIHRRR